MRQYNRSGISNLKKENYIHQISAIDHFFFISLKVYISYIVILTFFNPFKRMEIAILQ